MTGEAFSPPARLRSALYVPGDKPRAIAKAQDLGADALILDLEDAVAPEAKHAARAAAPDAITAFRKAGAYSVLRICAPGETGHEADLACAAAARPDAVLAAKAEDAGALAQVRQRLQSQGWSGPLWLMIETPLGMYLADRMATDRSLVHVLGASVMVAGSNDLAEGLRLPEGAGRRAALLPHLSRLVLAARVAGLGVLDGVWNAYGDEDGFRAEAAEGRAMGFDGKTLIHPSQAGPCHDVFAPSPDEIARARAIIAAFAAPGAAGRGALAFRGGMIERLHLDAARLTLAAAGLDPDQAHTGES
ncbi:CoA ester lyase [Alkalicaulis satelles]|uniref:CoA ester lyase n=1 Tax=Alkalicaulis satelles TaxID=2609175 RepID=A0A5M6ZNH3_9PROT|nr:CoA ester lyase [Alkalicaulis satelles]KAA5803781.1 CoA ester lyase [Alkalicaulis satelles]